MDVYRQRVIVDVVWARPIDSDKDPRIDWQSELAQALNEADNYSGTIWNVTVEPLEKLETPRNVSRIPGPYWCRRCRGYEIGPICSRCEFATDVA